MTGGDHPRSAWPMLSLLATGEFLGMTLWFSATAVTPALVGEFRLSTGQAAWLTMAVQGGFVAGTLVSALLNAPDLLGAPRLFAIGCLGGSLATAAITQAHTGLAAILLRLATGASLAWVYPTGLKLAASWFRERRGTALAVLVAALTVGQAFPHLLALLVHPGNWRITLLVTSALAIAGGGIVLGFVRDGPYAVAAERFDPHAAARVYRDRATRLAIFGYLGHQWELYAMWTWIGAFAGSSLAVQGGVVRAGVASGAAFIGVAAGAVGCLVAGFAADRLGKARVAGLALLVSGSCALASPLIFGGHPALVYSLVAIWGAAVVADSAQFSALVADGSRPQYVGTALTVETCSGYLLTMLTIRVIPSIASAVGWRWAFLALVPGPAFGWWAMRQLGRRK